jgi:perosamine synthetase
LINQVEPNYGEEEINNLVDYLNSGGWITEHTVTESFNEKIKDFVNREYSLSVPSGTTALYLALLAIGIGPGKKVAVPNITMIASLNSILWAGGEPVLVDVDEEMCMSLDKLKTIENLSAVIYVPLNGRTENGKEIEDWCKNNNIKLIEDSAHALGSKYQSDEFCGSLGDISIFSFTPHKIITMGQGGMVLTNNEQIYEFLYDLKTFNREKDKMDVHKGFGLNFKITDIQASFGLAQFKKLNQFINKKNDIFRSYSENVDSKFFGLKTFKKFEVPWFIDIELKDNNLINKLHTYLMENDIETRFAYPPLSSQNFTQSFEATSLNFSKSLDQKILWLPSSTKLEEKDIHFISEKLNKFSA